MVLRTDESRHWHFDKRLSLDTIVAIIGIAFVIGGPLMLAWRSMDTRVLRLETIYEESQKAEAVRDRNQTDQRTQLSIQIDRLSSRLEALQIDVAKLVGAATATAGGQIILQGPTDPTHLQPRKGGVQN